MKNNICVLLVLLFLSILTGCGSKTPPSSGYRLDPAVYTLPSESEAMQYAGFFVDAINAGDYEKIDATIDPAAMDFFMEHPSNSFSKKLQESLKESSEDSLRQIKSCSSNPKLILSKEGAKGFIVEISLKSGKAISQLFTLYKNGKGKTGVCLVGIAE